MPVSTLDVLANLSATLLRAPSLNEGLRALTEAALQATPADHASVRLCGPDQRLSVQARSGVGQEAPTRAVEPGEGVLGWVAQHGQPARIGDGQRDPRFKLDASVGFPVASILSVPIIADGRTLGVLSMSAGRRDAFDAAHETVATLLANTAAQTLRTAELAQQAITDAHTDAYNRRHLLPRLREEMERAQRRHEPLSLLLMDLDHFKRVNDEHGHDAGDLVLKAFVKRVKAAVRSIDVLIRRGGEEFVLILPATDAHAAMQVAERVRLDLAQRPMSLPDGAQLRQTVSIGVAQWDSHEEATALDRRADRAMYEAKRGGRDRVRLAAPDADRTPLLARLGHGAPGDDHRPGDPLLERLILPDATEATEAPGARYPARPADGIPADPTTNLARFRGPKHRIWRP